MKKLKIIIILSFVGSLANAQGWITNNTTWTQNNSSWRSDVNPTPGYDNTLILEGTTYCGAPGCRWASETPSGWVKFDFGTNRTFTGFRIFNDYQAAQQPKTCRLQYSNSFNGSWTTISSYTCTSAGWQWEEFPYFASTTARYWQLVIDDSYGGGRFQICEVGFFEGACIVTAPTANNNGPVCSGSSLSVTASSISGATYNWSGPNGFSSTSQNSLVSSSATTLMSGSYYVSATVNSCTSAVATTNVTVNPLPPATITPSGTTTFCQGDSIMLTANSANSYLWNGGATTQSISVSSSGNFSVTVSNANGCSATSSAINTVVNSLPIVAPIAVAVATFCQGNSVTLTAGMANSYLWSNGLTTQSISVAASGNYSVTITNSLGCSSTSPSTAVSIAYCSVNIDLRAFIEGFYISGTDSMLPTIDPINYPTICDTVTLQLADSASHQIVASDKNVISTQGRGTFNFSGLLPGHRYYLVIRHRNSLETWSKYSYLFDNPVLNIDFTR